VFEDSKWYFYASKYFPPEIALKKSKVLLGYATKIQAMSYAFQDTFTESGIYAVVGCMILILFLWEEYHARRQGSIATARKGKTSA